MILDMKLGHKIIMTKFTDTDFVLRSGVSLKILSLPPEEMPSQKDVTGYSVIHYKVERHLGGWCEVVLVAVILWSSQQVQHFTPSLPSSLLIVWFSLILVLGLYHDVLWLYCLCICCVGWCWTFFGTFSKVKTAFIWWWLLQCVRKKFSSTNSNDTDL